MPATSPGDGRVRSHEEAAALLRAAVPGARVTVQRPHLRAWNQRNAESDRMYTIALERLGEDPLVLVGGYSLPADADRLATDARTHVVRALTKAPR